ncbi:MAG: T9SS type A sorting domain-containing protein [Candidatus Marinimicrobia bacterium]|nr:T9SS type A sorting domain-containing protein [Candidatus Neomarinimicrobiota bacterium]
MSCRNNRLITTLAIVLSSTLLGQAPDTLWTKTYGSTRDAILFSIDQTADGGFIMSGSVGLFADSSVFWLVRTKADGDTLWTRTYGDPDSNNICQSGLLTFDGGYIMAGLGGMWLIKTDADGDTLWTRRTGGPGGQEPVMVAQTADSGYIITGNIAEAGLNAQLGLIKTDSQGNTQWTKTCGGPGDEFGGFVQQTADSGYIILGTIIGEGGVGRDIWLLKADAEGDTTWTTTFTLGEGEPNVVRQTADSGYAIFGLIQGTLDAPVTGGDDRDWLLIKTNNLGNLEWSRTYGGDLQDQSMDMILTGDGGFLLTGFLDLTASGNSVDLWLVRVDSLGDTLWTTTVGDAADDGGLGLVQIAEGEYAVAGFTGSFDAGEIDGWLVRFGDVVISVAEKPATPTVFALHANYPNPFNPTTTIGFELPVAAVVTLTVYDILGQEVRRLANRTMGAGYHQADWDGRTSDGREAPTGIYFAQLVTPTSTRAIKMVLLK